MAKAPEEDLQARAFFASVKTLTCMMCGTDTGDTELDLCQSCAAKLIERMRDDGLTCRVCGTSYAVDVPRVRKNRTTAEPTAYLCWVCARLANSVGRETDSMGLM